MAKPGVGGQLTSVTLSISQAVEILRHAPLEIPVMMWSDTGAGKSQVVKQLADSMGVPLKTSIAQVTTPVDWMGIPTIRRLEGGRPITEFTQPGMLPDVEVDGERGVYFFDELPNATRNVQAAIQSLLTRGEYNGYVWPKGWKQICAGNRMRDKANTYEMPRPVRNRMMHLSVGYDLRSFQDWGRRSKSADEGGLGKDTFFPSIHDLVDDKDSRIHPLIRLFLERSPEMIHCEGEDQEAFATPRSWEYASHILRLGVNPEMTLIMIQGLVGPTAAAQLHIFLNDAASLPDPKVLLSGKGRLEKKTDGDGATRTHLHHNGTSMQLESSQVFVLAGSLAAAVRGDKTIKAFFELIQQFCDAEYEVLAITELHDRMPEIASTDEFSKWADDHSESPLFR